MPPPPPPNDRATAAAAVNLGVPPGPRPPCSAVYPGQDKPSGPFRPLSCGAAQSALLFVVARPSWPSFAVRLSPRSLSRSSSVSSLTPTLHSVVSTRALSRRQAAAPPPLSGLLKAVERGTTKSTMIRSGTDGMADVRALARAKKGQMCRTVAINYYVGCSCR